MESAGATAKRTSLESLSKEELLQKCKALLSIAQRAKAAKDEALEECKGLKDEVEILKKSKNQDEATAEILEALTAQKLQLTTELDEAKRAATTESAGLRAKAAEQEVQIESLRRQLSRAEDDCSALETRLDKLDAENRRLACVANEAEAQLRRGATERQDALEGLGDELANVKNAAAEALAERDRLRNQLQQHSPSSNFQMLETCQALAQELRGSQSLLVADVSQLQSAARSMAAELGEALVQAQVATESAARHSSKDLLAQMNEAMKTRGEVAAQLAEKLTDMKKQRDALQEERDESMKAVEELSAKYQVSQHTSAEYKRNAAELKQQLENTTACLKQLQDDNANKTSELNNAIQAKEVNDEEIENLQDSVANISKQKSELEAQLKNEKLKLAEVSSSLEERNKKLELSRGSVDALENQLQDVEAENVELRNNEQKLTSVSEIQAQTIHQLEDTVLQMKQATQEGATPEVQQVQSENNTLRDEILKLKSNNKELDQTIIVLQEKLDAVENVYQELQEKNNAIVQLTHSKQSLEKEMSALLEASETQRESEAVMSDLLQVSKNELCEMLARIESLTSEMTKIGDDKASLVTEVDAMRANNEELLLNINNLQFTITASETLKESLQKEIAEVRGKNKELADAASSLREKLCDFERERDDCEGASVSTVSRTDDAARLRDVEDSFEERYTKLRAVAVKLKQKCHDQASVLAKVLAERTELQSKLTTLNKERDTLARNVQSMQTACDAATDEAEAARDAVAQSNKELKRAGEELARSRNQCAELTEKLGLLEVKLQQTHKDLESSKQENKKSCVLNLEMAAYERSAAEQDKKLSQMKEEVEALKAEVECQKSVAEENENRAKHWEEQSTNVSCTKRRLEDELSNVKAQLTQAQDVLAAESQRHSDTVSRFEAKRSELERTELQVAQLTAEKLNADEASKTFREQAARQIHILEEQVSTTLATVRARDDEMSSLRAEFDGYKVRAQGVLHRQQQLQPKEDAQDVERENELCVLKTTVERLQTALCDSSAREKSLQAEVSVVTGQNGAMQLSARNLAAQVAEMKAKYEQLTSKLQKSEDALRDVTRQHRLSMDTLSSSYKQQLAEAEKRHKTQIANIQAAQEEIAQQNQSCFLDQEQPPTLQPREEGEGSENVDCPKVASCDNRREPLPLERLLSSSSDLPDETKSEFSLDAASVSSVLASERRAKHLAALLGEAEADLARLSQQNAVLKEEIRRQQRCMERQQHTLSNGEYLKNVVLKFVTLQGGDERARLVPVLNTILKLSPEETQQLQTVATGINPASPGAAASANSWGSYLHLWSGTH